MTRFSVAAAFAALILAPAAQAATYTGDFSAIGGYITGSFSGEDRDGDARISLAELTGFSARVSNMNGGPGQFMVDVAYANHFLFYETADGAGWLSGTVTYFLAEQTCGGWNQPPCWMPQDKDAMAGLRMLEFAYGDPTVIFTPRMESFTADRVRFEVLGAPLPAAVPVPGGLPLMAAGLGALAVLRRRRRT